MCIMLNAIIPHHFFQALVPRIFLDRIVICQHYMFMHLVVILDCIFKNLLLIIMMIIMFAKIRVAKEGKISVQLMSKNKHEMWMCNDNNLLCYQFEESYEQRMVRNVFCIALLLLYIRFEFNWSLIRKIDVLIYVIGLVIWLDI